MRFNPNYPTTIGNGLNDNSVILKMYSLEYSLFSIATRLYIRCSRWKGVPETKYPLETEGSLVVFMDPSLCTHTVLNVCLNCARKPVECFYQLFQLWN